MSDNTDSKESVIAKFGGWIGILLALFASMFFLDQGEIFGETVPAAWTRLKQVVARGGEKAKQAYWTCAIWLQGYLKLARRVTYIWWAVAGIFLAAGVWGQVDHWSGHTALALRLVGIYLFAGYWFTVAALAKPLYYGAHALMKGAVVAARAVGQTAHNWLAKLGIDTPVPEVTPADAEKLEAGATAFQRFFFTIASLVLLFGTFFAPSGEPATAVKLLAVGMPLAALAAFAAKHGWKSELGWKALGVAVMIAFVVLTFSLFGETLVPAPIRNWFSGRNQSELIVLVLFAIPISLWVAAAFWKSKRDAFNMAAKRLFWVCSILIVFLWIKGPITSKGLTGHEAVGKDKLQDVGEIVDAKWQRKIDQERADVGLPSKYGTSPVSKATYVAPPAGSSGEHEASKPQPAARVTRTHRNIVVPPAEAPKHYRSAGQALADLDADD